MLIHGFLGHSALPGILEFDTTGLKQNTWILMPAGLLIACATLSKSLKLMLVNLEGAFQIKILCFCYFIKFQYVLWLDWF